MPRPKFCLILLLSCSFCSAQTSYPNLPGKFCEDLGFGWVCVKFKSKGKYEMDAGHSYRAHRTKGSWVFKNDTLVLTPKTVRKIKPRRQLVARRASQDIHYYLLKSDTLYSLNFNDSLKRLEKGNALQRSFTNCF
jgi:hypothetical protein